MRWGRYTLPAILTDQVEIVDILRSDGVIEHRARSGVLKSSLVVNNYLGLDTLVDHYKGKFALFGKIKGLKSSLDLLNLALHDNVLLRLADSISIEDNRFRVDIVLLLKELDDILHENGQVLSNLIIFSFLNADLCTVTATSLVD